MVSGKAKGCAIGCGAVLLIAVILCAGAFWFVKSKYDAELQAFKDKGYKVVGSLEDFAFKKTIRVTEAEDEPTIYIAYKVELTVGSDRGVAFLCDSAEIHGKVVGNVNFMGKELTIHKAAVLERDLVVKVAAILNNYGTVKGEITGFQGAINKTPPPNYYDK